jgi:hypothetical protein
MKKYIIYYRLCVIPLPVSVIADDIMTNPKVKAFALIPLDIQTQLTQSVSYKGGMIMLLLLIHSCLFPISGDIAEIVRSFGGPKR